MSVSSEDLVKNIRHYQESLEKYSSIKNNYKLLDIIKKLKRLPIATAHLEHTGIGRTVNGLRKLGGEVGDAAKSLVAKWKEMVMEEEEKVKKEALEESVNTTCSTENDIDNYESTEEAIEDIKDRGNESTSSHISSDTEKKSSDKYKKELDKHGSNSRKSPVEKKDNDRDRESSKKRKQEYPSDSEDYSSKKKHVTSSSESDDDVYDERNRKLKSQSRHRSDSSEDENKRHKSKKAKYSNDDSSSEEKEHRSKTSHSSKNHRSSSKSKSNGKTDNKKQDYDSQKKDEKSKSKHKSDNKSKRDSDCEESKSSTKHKSKKDSKPSESEDVKAKSKHESKSRHDKESSRSKDSKSHSSRPEKHETKDKKENRPSDSKETHSHKKDENKKHEDKHKKSKSEKENDRKEKSSSSGTSKSEEHTKSSSNSSKQRSSSERKKDKEKVKPVNKEKIVNGIDSGSGASFADALGMCGPVKSSKSPVAKKKKSSSVASPEKPKASSSYVKPERYDDDEDDEDNVPTLLKQEPPEPLNLNISSLLPEITPHYKPLGLPLDSQPRRVLTQDEALSQAISNKNMRTKVYSGNKTYGKMESLFDLCVRVLQDNIDALEYTGGVPFLILKPVLERATPDQLFNMEHHNPYLIEDTDELWHLHCQKEFRTKKREELESWREMYMRCLDEREARLNAITANIKQSQDKSIPVRTTKLAYVDSVVKPPRNIARKQAKNGIIVARPAQTPASRLSALATAGDAGKVAVPNPAGRAVDRSSSSSSNAAALKPKKAPLMAKTLSLFKNRFRR